jgi:hypothetical protein
MHVFLLILTITGRPEAIGGICDTYRKCSDQGAELAVEYDTKLHIGPADFSYRVVEGMIIIGKGQGT